MFDQKSSKTALRDSAKRERALHGRLMKKRTPVILLFRRGYHQVLYPKSDDPFVQTPVHLGQIQGRPAPKLNATPIGSQVTLAPASRIKEEGDDHRESEGCAPIRSYLGSKSPDGPIRRLK